MVLYHYNSNAILVYPMKNRSDHESLEAYKYFYDYLIKRNCHLQHNAMDNEASKAVKNYIVSTNAKYQLVEPHNKRVNADEKAIQTFKDHFISGLSSVHNKFPLFFGMNSYHRPVLPSIFCESQGRAQNFRHTNTLRAYLTSHHIR